jgi:hypothetical protein
MCVGDDHLQGSRHAIARHGCDRHTQAVLVGTPDSRIVLTPVRPGKTTAILTCSGVGNIVLAAAAAALVSLALKALVSPLTPTAAVVPSTAADVCDVLAIPRPSTALPLALERGILRTPGRAEY